MISYILILSVIYYIIIFFYGCIEIWYSINYRNYFNECGHLLEIVCTHGVYSVINGSIYIIFYEKLLIYSPYVIAFDDIILACVIIGQTFNLKESCRSDWIKYAPQINTFIIIDIILSWINLAKMILTFFVYFSLRLSDWINGTSHDETDEGTDTSTITDTNPDTNPDIDNLV